jgi:hypothetical protein
LNNVVVVVVVVVVSYVILRVGVTVIFGFFAYNILRSINNKIELYNS